MSIILCLNKKNDKKLVDDRNIRTRAHDAILYITVLPRCEKFKCNVFYYGARLWNQLPVLERRIEKYTNFKNVEKAKVFHN